MKYSFLILYFIIAQTCWAFPEMSRHGYFNCTSCHLSPAGGGALTLYGRELSKELLSTSSVKGEQYFAYNAIPALSKSDKILLGAYIRGLQVLRENDQVNEARTILMQADAEAAYNDKSWAILGTVGRQEVRNGLESRGHFFSRRHYVLGRFDKHQNIRLGKFLKSYGLDDPNHYMFIRNALNFSYDTESYNVEYSYLAENFNAYLTVITNLKTDDYLRNDENGLAFNGSLKFDKSKLGLSLFHGTNARQRRMLGGLWGIGTFTKQFFLMSELDFQAVMTKLTRTHTNGTVMSHRLNYEVYKGIIPFLSFDQKYLNFSNKNSELHSIGLGARLFPRPHFEITGAVQREARIANSSKDTLYWLMGQLYL